MLCASVEIADTHGVTSDRIAAAFGAAVKQLCLTHDRNRVLACGDVPHVVSGELHTDSCTITLHALARARRQRYMRAHSVRAGHHRFYSFPAFLRFSCAPDSPVTVSLLVLLPLSLTLSLSHPLTLSLSSLSVSLSLLSLSLSLLSLSLLSCTHTRQCAARSSINIHMHSTPPLLMTPYHAVQPSLPPRVRALASSPLSSGSWPATSLPQQCRRPVLVRWFTWPQRARRRWAG